MRVFILAAAAAVVIAVVAQFGLSAIQKSSAQAYATSAARLDYQERVNNYGREG
jgi:hypothetical protein